MKHERPESTPRIVRLADQLAQDVAAQGLGSGDPYLNTAEAARLLGVSTASANRAMQLLVQRRILSRSQGRGTVVVNPVASRRPEIGCVHLLIRKDYIKTEGLLADGVVVGLQGELPDTQMQFNFLPETDARGFVSKLISRAARASEPQAFLLVRSSLAAQRELEQSGFPAVVYGSLYPSIRRLPSLDRDNHQGGRLLADYALRGARRLTVLLRERSFAGDFAFLDGILDAATAAGFAPNQIIVRHMPSEQQAVVDLVRSLPLKGGMGVICRSQPLGEAVVSALSELPDAIRRSTRIAVSDVYRPTVRTQSFARLERDLPAEEIGRAIGQLLLDSLAGKEPARRLIPVRLVAPVNGVAPPPHRRTDVPRSPGAEGARAAADPQGRANRSERVRDRARSAPKGKEVRRKRR